MTVLPPELIFTNVYSYLTPTTILFELTPVCKEWYHIIHSSQFWKEYYQVVNKEQHSPYGLYTKLVTCIEPSNTITEKQVEDLHLVARNLVANKVEPSDIPLFVPLPDTQVVQVNLPFKYNENIEYVPLYLQLMHNKPRGFMTEETLTISYLEDINGTVLSSNKVSEAHTCHTADLCVTFVSWHGSTSCHPRTTNLSAIEKLLQYMQLDDILEYFIALMKVIYKTIIGSFKRIPIHMNQQTKLLHSCVPAIERMKKLYYPSRLIPLAIEQGRDDIAQRLKSCELEPVPPGLINAFDWSSFLSVVE
jgi:hypothetical protein